MSTVIRGRVSSGAGDASFSSKSGSLSGESSVRTTKAQVDAPKTEKRKLPKRNPQYKPRFVIAEDQQWTLQTIPSLNNLCLKYAIVHFENHTDELRAMPRSIQRKIVPHLPVTLPLQCKAPVIVYRFFWEKCCRARWPVCNVEAHGGEWRRMYLERNLEELIETFIPNKSNLSELEEVVQLSAKFVRKLDIQQMLPPAKAETLEALLKLQIKELNQMAKAQQKAQAGDDEEEGEENDDSDTDDDRLCDHFDFEPVLKKLSFLEDLQIRYRLRDCGMNFDFKHFRPTLRDCIQLGRSVCQSEQLRALRLQNNALDDERIRSMISQFLDHPNLTELDLSCNLIGDDGARTLAKFLCMHSRLTNLNLADNHIETRGAKYLGKALSWPNTLEFLNLRLNTIGEDGGQAIFKGLLENTSLLEINLNCAGLGFGSTEVLAKVLKRNTVLHTINLACNSFGHEGGAILREAMSNNTTITEMDLWMTECGQQNMDEITDVVYRNRENACVEMLKAEEERRESAKRESQDKSRLTRLPPQFAHRYNYVPDEDDFYLAPIVDPHHSTLGGSLRDQSSMDDYAGKYVLTHYEGSMSLPGAETVEESWGHFEDTSGTISQLQTYVGEWLETDSEEARTFPKGNARKQRCIIAEDSDWTLQTIPSLVDLCVNLLASRFEKEPEILLRILPEYQRKLILRLPTTLPLKLTVPLIRFDGYWQKLCTHRWPVCDVAAHGGCWKRMYLERRLQQLIEVFVPGKTDPQELHDTLKLASRFVKKLDVKQLLPPVNESKNYATKKKFEKDEEDEEEDEDEERVEADDLESDHIDFLPIVQKLPCLEELHVKYRVRRCGANFQFNLFYPTLKDCKRLGQSVKECTELKKVRLAESQADDRKIRMFISQFVDHSSLTELDLSGNLIGDEGAYCVAVFFHKCHTLLRLNLCNNVIGGPGGDIIAKALRKNTTLTHLNLRMNSLGDVGGHALAVALMTNSTLIDLNLSSNEMEEPSADIFGKMMIQNSTLKVLDLSNNFFEPKGGEYLKKGIEANNTILELDVRKTACGEATILDIKRALHRNNETVRNSMLEKQRAEAPPQTTIPEPQAAHRYGLQALRQQTRRESTAVEKTRPSLLDGHGALTRESSGELNLSHFEGRMEGRF